MSSNCYNILYAILEVIFNNFIEKNQSELNRDIEKQQEKINRLTAFKISVYILCGL